MSPQPQAAVGAPLSRVDGRLKVTGQATYAAEHEVDGVVHAVIVDASIGRGRVTGVDADAALAHPEVLRVIHHRNAPTLPYRDNPGSNNLPGRKLRVFQDDRVLFHGQPVAVVVATTLEAAQHGASLVKVEYDAEDPSTDLHEAEPGPPDNYARGDVEAGLRDAAVRLDLTYQLARNHHNPMEPHATIARWDGNRLTVWDKSQWVAGGTQTELSTVFDVPLDSVRVINPFVGGAFGSGLRCWPHTVVAALAARETARPVKLVLTRRQMYFGTGFRPSYDYRLSLGGDRNGRLVAADHRIEAETSSYETFTEAVMSPGQMLYSTPGVRQAYRTVPLDVNSPIWMRGPGAATGVYAVESAMDELAHELGMDPIELRRRNEPAQDPSNNTPFSTRRLLECYTVGAREFGWQRRNQKPRSRRDGDWLIGMGMAAGVYHTAVAPAQSRARLNADGTAVVESATSDMGPGTYTAQTQVAADALGLAVRAVTYRLGDSLYPQTPPHGGSMTMASVGSATLDVCNQLRRQAIRLAVEDEESPLYGVPADEVVVRGARLHVQGNPARGETYQRLLTRNNRDRLEASTSFSPPQGERRSISAYSAVFAEVAVDSTLGLVRVRRMLAVYDAGRIISPKLADSQALGGMVGGIGAALLEHTATDHRDGRIVNANLADYLVPVNADVPDLRAIYLDGEDYDADPLGVKGLAELVIVGVAPAIGNAVFNATGRRVREIPITAEALL
ncbi:xanthine dehydrogenase family protein molybdopterin-binding subunit [Streptomyces sp. NBC_01314]|uniref:xanthine dehydrogenase family protein molybdopterin-binding subunit n=1 Tax=Streptomyces sp. NBC_01314 TaxID=2903821 RepID=UPI003090032D|nr:xanthine dehydrogenase family protein molybdopterin-binding subunit [Streptomyces sp. NBC_01314]